MENEGTTNGSFRRRSSEEFNSSERDHPQINSRLRNYLRQNSKAYDLIHKMYIIKRLFLPIIDDIIKTAASKVKHTLSNKDHEIKYDGYEIKDSHTTKLFSEVSKEFPQEHATQIIPKEEMNDSRKNFMRYSIQKLENDQKLHNGTKSGRQEKTEDMINTQFIPHERRITQETVQQSQDKIGMATYPSENEMNSEITISDVLTHLNDVLQGPLRESIKRNPDIMERMTYLLERLSKNLDSIIINHPQLQDYTSISYKTKIVHRCILLDPQRTIDGPCTSQKPTKDCCITKHQLNTYTSQKRNIHKRNSCIKRKNC